MKIQCVCGAKFLLDITPEMANAPVRLTCRDCGLDISEQVNQLIRMELGAAPEPAAPAKPVAIRVLAPVEPAPPSDAPPPCPKHVGEYATERCVVCQKPMCPKCMELFGYVCSPFCQAKAEAQGIDVPSYARQHAVVERSHWRTVGRRSYAIAAAVLVVVGVWFWYAWFGSPPKVAVSVRLTEPAYAGQCRLLGRDQAIWLHGPNLTRYDLTARREVWSRPLLDRKQIADEGAAEYERMKAARMKAVEKGADFRDGGWFTPADITRQLERSLTAALGLHVHGTTIWVSFPDKLVRYDWQTGAPGQEIPFGSGAAELFFQGDDCLVVSEKDSGQRALWRINLVTGTPSTEELVGEAAPQLASTAAKPGPARAPTPGSDTKALDPAEVAARAQSLPLPNRLALPATLAANANQRRLMEEMRDTPKADSLAAEQLPPVPPPALLPSGDGFVQVSIKRLEAKINRRDAMKAPPAQSALNGETTSGRSAEVANEILNDMQRNATGGFVLEDVSRYQVTLLRHGGGDASEWTGEVVGLPALFPLKTVDVLVAGKTARVFDKVNKKLWESPLSYEVGGGWEGGESRLYGDGPCVERGNTLYLFDQGMLRAFELATGNVRWGLPTVGILGLLFDGAGMLYVNTTTASHEHLKYSRQIDISEKTRQLVLKVEPKTGKILWRAEQDGLVARISGKFVYTLQSHEEAEESGNALDLPLGQIPSHICIKRLDPGNGRVLWRHYQRRAPLDVQFDQNRIQILFKKEMQVLKFMSL